MENNQNLEVIMSLIMYGGDAKSLSMEAIQAAKEGDFSLAYKKLVDADKSLENAHHSQTSMLTEEANGNSVEVNLLTIHGQDHLMTAITFTDLAKEIVELYKTIGEK